MKLLDGIRILDLTNVLSGPFATLHFALAGADVIKIENPENGDLARNLGCVPEYNQKLMGTSFLAQNANKKSITLNLKSTEGKTIFKKLAADSDIVVENFRPDVMNRLGLSYDILSEINPRLIYCAISGFGQSGPDSSRPAYDQIIQGLSGEMAINGDENFHPLRAGFPLCDTVGGLNAAFAVMAALFYRERTGEGQFIDVALLDSIMPLMGWVVANLMIGHQQPILMGNDNFTASPSGVFKTKNGFMNISANKQEQWENLADLLGLSELKRDPRFQNNDVRKKNRKELTSILNERLAEKDTAEWVEQFNEHDIPAGAILTLDQAIKQEQVKFRNTFGKVTLDGIGDLELFNLTAKFSKTPGLVETAPPTLGQHTNEILKQIGYTTGQIQKFREMKVI